jgi:hypothetical protein
MVFDSSHAAAGRLTLCVATTVRTLAANASPAATSMATRMLDNRANPSGEHAPAPIAIAEVPPTRTNEACGRT